MWNLGLEAAWAGFLTLSLQYLFMGFRMRSGKDFLLIGSSLGLSCLIGGFNILSFQESHRDLAEKWASYQKGAIFLGTPLLFFLNRILLNLSLVRLIRFFFVFSLLNVFYWLVLALNSWNTSRAFAGFASAWKDFGGYMFVIYQIAAAGTMIMIWRMRAKSRDPSGDDIILPLLSGWAAQSIFGILGALCLLESRLDEYHLLMAGGLVCYGVGTFSTVIRSFLNLYFGQRNSSARLERIYEDLEKSGNPLNLVGRGEYVKHEFKNFLAVLKGNRVLLTKGQGPEGHFESLERLARTTLKLQRFTSGLLDYSQALGQSKKEIVSLTSVINGCIKCFSAEDVHFAVKGLDAEPLPILFEEGKLDQIFVNIFKNSVEAGSRNIMIEALSTPGAMEIRIEDDGEGCDEPRLQGLFRPFFTTKKDRGGTGLGMPLVREIMEANEGRITAISKNLMSRAGQGLIIGLFFKNLMQKDGSPLAIKHGSSGET